MVFERSETGFGAFVPDLPGCIAAAETETEVRRVIAEAVQLHVESLRETGQPIPAPSHSVGYVDVGGATPDDRENEAWDREIARREQEIDAGAAETVSADVVFEELGELLERLAGQRLIAGSGASPKLSLDAVVERDARTGLLVGHVPGLPGVHSQGASIEELKDQLREVVHLLLEDAGFDAEAERIAIRITGWTDDANA